MRSTSLNDLAFPVQLRAIAHNLGAFGAFSDKFALSVLNKLAITLPDRSPYPEISRNIGLCHWVDMRARAFFETHSNAEGVEFNSGLSTRFYRLSETMDWPRFSWACVNTPKSDAYLKKVFPALDNFRCVVCEDANDAGYRYIGTSAAQKKFVIIGENTPLNTMAELIEVLAILTSTLTPKRPVIDLVLCHSLPCLEPTLALIAARIAILSSFLGKRPRFKDWILNPTSLLSRPIYGHHLRIEMISQGGKV